MPKRESQCLLPRCLWSSVVSANSAYQHCALGGHLFSSPACSASQSLFSHSSSLTMELLITQHSPGAPQPSGGLGFLLAVWAYGRSGRESQTNYSVGMDGWSERYVRTALISRQRDESFAAGHFLRWWTAGQISGSGRESLRPKARQLLYAPLLSCCVEGGREFIVITAGTGFISFPWLIAIMSASLLHLNSSEGMLNSYFLIYFL